ncbi:hypothetical protein [Desulfovirgula thermocuniculi]|uniref:hypothetical protein n=1 Tax=Desulfovirgula thermocuniculi TaxID=348842 RepID=UPI00041B841C|nr:hypothetical protein [Desulfovirgula thermocuniculi]
MGIRESLNKVNSMTGELAFIAGREKGEIDDLLDEDITIDELAIVTSKFDNGKENAVFTVADDHRRFYRTGSSTAVAALKELAAGLEEDGLGWDALTVRFERVKSKQGRRYYVVKAELKPAVEAALAKRDAAKGAAAKDFPVPELPEDDFPF